MTNTDTQVPKLGRLVQRTVGTCFGMLENRAELFALEFEEENERVLKLVIFGASGLFLGMMTLLLITGIVIFLVPVEDRLWAAFGFAVLYGAGSAGAVFIVKQLLKQSPFSESLNQIKKDAELLDAFK